MRRLHSLAIVVAIAALLASAAHVLEMPNKLMLEGPFWLAVQQRLYRGWGRSSARRRSYRPQWEIGHAVALLSVLRTPTPSAHRS